MESRRLACGTNFEDETRSQESRPPACGTKQLRTSAARKAGFLACGTKQLRTSAARKAGFLACGFDCGSNYLDYRCRRLESLLSMSPQAGGLLSWLRDEATHEKWSEAGWLRSIAVFIDVRV